MNKTIAWILSFLIWGTLMLYSIIAQNGLVQLGSFLFLGIAFYYIEKKKIFQKKIVNQGITLEDSHPSAPNGSVPDKDDLIAKPRDKGLIIFMLVISFLAVLIGLIIIIVSLITHDSDGLSAGLGISSTCLLLALWLVVVLKKLGKRIV